jgi:hypothetical protein
MVTESIGGVNFSLKCPQAAKVLFAIYKLKSEISQLRAPMYIHWTVTGNHCRCFEWWLVSFFVVTCLLAIETISTRYKKTVGDKLKLSTDCLYETLAKLPIGDGTMYLESLCLK